MSRQQLNTQKSYQSVHTYEYLYDANETEEDNIETTILPVHNITNTNNTSEFEQFIREIKAIDMCNLFVQCSTMFCFGEYVYSLIDLLNVKRYTNDSLKKIVNMLRPKQHVQNINDADFLYRLLDFTIAVINETALNTASMEILLLFNLLNSPRAKIQRDDSNDKDLPALIGSNDNLTVYNFPSRLRYLISLNLMDVYELSCKPDILFKRIRHPSYQEKCKMNTINKYTADVFLNSLKMAKSTIRNNNDDILEQYKCFLKRNHNLLIHNTNTNKYNYQDVRKTLSQDIETVQTYPSLRRSIIEETLQNVCKVSLSVERYVATRTSTSMENENYQYPNFIHFCTM